MSDTPITPSACAITLTGIALALVAGTATIRTPPIGSSSLSGIAPSVVAQLQTEDVPGTVNLLKGDSQTGIIKRWPGGAGWFDAEGTWGGASVQLQFVGADAQTFIPIGSALTANGGASFSLPPGYIQAAITNATTTSLTAAARAVPTFIA